MNDADIIKALECCVESECEECKYEHDTACKEYILHDCIRFINIQKEEIDKLKIEICALSEKRITFPERLKIVKHARESAIKAFAERLIAYATLPYSENHIISAENIELIAREMTRYAADNKNESEENE